MLFGQTVRTEGNSACVAFAPAVGQFAAGLFTDHMLPQTFITTGAVMKTAASIVLVQFAVQLVCLFLYLKVIQASTPSIAVFVYLSSVQILPGIIHLAMASVEMTALLAVYIGLHVMFYYLSVVPIARFRDSKQQKPEDLPITAKWSFYYDGDATGDIEKVGLNEDIEIIPGFHTSDGKTFTITGGALKNL